MGYGAGMLDKRIAVLGTQMQDTAYGRVTSEWQTVGNVWASVEWSKGAKAMREGMLDAYDVLMVRTRYVSFLERDSRLLIEGKTYAIESYHSSKRQNTIQITAREIED